METTTNTNNTETGVSAQDQAIQKAKSSAERKFEAAIAETAELVSQCAAIVITDSTTLSMANNILSKANQSLKSVELKRKEIIKPWSDQVDFVNDLVKTKLTNPLKLAVESGKEKLRLYNEAQVKKANEAKADVNKQLTFLKTCESNMRLRVEASNTPEACTKLIELINKQWPANEKFGPYLAEATKTKNNFIALLNTKITALKGALSNDIEVVTEAFEKIEEVTEEQAVIAEDIQEKTEFIEESIQPEMGSVRRIWAYEVIDEQKLPREFLSIDPKKVKEYLNANKDKFDEAGTVKGGIRFFRDSQPIIK